jgi:hypothetical protein
VILGITGITDFRGQQARFRLIRNTTSELAKYEDTRIRGYKTREFMKVLVGGLAQKRFSAPSSSESVEINHVC